MILEEKIEEEIIGQYALNVKNLENQIECINAQTKNRISALKYEMQQLHDEYKSRLISFYDEQKKADRVRGKTLHLACGLDILSVSKPKQLIISDEQILELWAAQNDPTLLVTETKISKLKLNIYYKATGEIPPGSFITDNNEVIQIRDPRGVK